MCVWAGGGGGRKLEQLYRDCYSFNYSNAHSNIVFSNPFKFGCFKIIVQVFFRIQPRISNSIKPACWTPKSHNSSRNQSSSGALT